MLRWAACLLVFAALVAALGLGVRRWRRQDIAQYEKGELHLQSGNTARAVGCFRRVLEMDQERLHLRAQLRIVEAYARGKDFGKAVEELQKAAEMGLSEAQVAMRHARLLSRRGAHRMQSAGAAVSSDLCDETLSEDIRQAIALVMASADASPDPAAAYTELGDLRNQEAQVLSLKHLLSAKAGDLARALERHYEAARWDAVSAEVFRQMEVARQSATEAYERAMEWEPSSPGPRVAMAQHMLNLNLPMPDRAREVLEPVIKDYPERREARQLLAVAERMAGNYDEALRHVRAVRTAVDEDVELLTVEIEILADAGRWQEAETLSRRLIELQPNNRAAAFLRGWVCLHCAQQEADASVSAPGGDSAQARLLNEAVSHLQNLVRDLEYALAPSPMPWPELRFGLTRARFALASALRRKGNREQAIGTFKEVIGETSEWSAVSVRMQLALLDMRQQSCRALAEELENSEPERSAGYRTQAALLHAKLLSLRADYRLALARRATDTRLVDLVLKENIEFAIALVEEHADAAERRALAYTQLGDLFMQKARVLATKQELLDSGSRGLDSVPPRPHPAAPASAEAAAVLPQISASQQSAMRAYRRAVELDEELAAPRLAIARYLLSIYVPRPMRARDLLEPIVAREPRHQEARKLLAMAARLAGSYDEALAQVRAAPKEDDDYLDLVLLETQILVDAGRWSEAEPLSRKLAELQPDDGGVAYLRGTVLLHEEDPQERPKALREAVISFRKVFEAGGRWPRARLAMAQALLALGEREQAADNFRGALDDVSATVRSSAHMRRELREVQYQSCLAMAEVLEEDDPASAAAYAAQAFGVFPERAAAFEAVAQARRASGARPEDLEDAVLVHASALADAGDPRAALDFCQEWIGGHLGQPGRLRLLRAGLLARTGSYRESLEEYEQLREALPDKSPTYEVAALHTLLGQYDDARRIYGELLASDPADERALTGLVTALVRAGDMAGARSAVRRAEEELGTPLAGSLLLNLYVHEGQTDEAVELARSQVEARPQDASAHLVLAELLWKLGRLAEARSSYDRALALQPGHIQACRRGLLDLQEGNVQEAVALFREGRMRNPGHPQPTVYLAVALQAAGRPGEALRVTEDALDQAEAHGPTTDMLRWYRAIMHAAQGNAHAAALQNDQVQSRQLGTWEDRHDLLNSLADAEPPLQERAAAALNLAAVFSRAGCVQATLAQVQLLKTLLPGELLPRCWYIGVLDQQGRSREATEEYERLLHERPDWAYVRLLLAMSHAGHGDVDAAIVALREALAYASEELAALIHLQLGRLHQGQNRLDAAIASYQMAMHHPATAPDACNNAAWIRATQKDDPVGALPLARRAVALGGETPERLDTLGWVHYLLGNAEEALELLRRAKAGRPSVPTVRYHLAMAYLQAGRRPEARAELEDALAISGAFPEAQEAADVLESL